MNFCALKRLVPAALVTLAMVMITTPPRAFAQGESRFTGAVLDPSGAP